MAKLLTLALLLTLAGAARGDGGEQPAPAAPPTKAEKPAAPKQRGAGEKPARKRGDAAPKPAKGAEAAPEKAPDGKSEKPCEPVKPCPID
jgi:hypothetical protein